MTGLTASSALALVAMVSVGSPSPVPQTLPTNEVATCAVAPATFAGWFQSGSPTLNGVVKPANSVTFPNSPNCSFYQWSKQMFLWATSPAPATYGGGGGRIFNSPAFFDVSPEDATGKRTLVAHAVGHIPILNLRAAEVGPNRLPIIFDKTGRMLEIEPTQVSPAGKQLILDSAGKKVEIERATLGANKKLTFIDSVGKPILNAKPIVRSLVDKVDKSAIVQKFVVGANTIFIDGLGTVVEVEQGEADGGVLLSQSGSLVYYIPMVNDVYAYFLTGTKDGGITPAPTRFPTSQAELNKITAFATAHGKTFPDPDALTIELKTSWVEASTVPNPSSYITMEATIPTYNKSNSHTWTPSGQKTTLLALVGIHVVGSAAGHPEMIWATFEHINNTPNATYAYNSTSGPKTVPQNTSGNWLFCASNASGTFNTPRMTFTGGDIVATSGNTIGPTNTIRSKPFGAAFDQSPNPLDATPAASNSEVISVNNTTIVPGGDVRNNYVLTGATWTIGGAAPSSGNVVGTSKLANTTMETFQQGTNNLAATGVSCLNCHSTNTISVSFIFPDIKPLF